MILKNIKKGNIHDLDLDHLTFKVVSDALSVNLINLHSIHGLVIKCNEIQTVRKILNQIRTKNDPAVYLMPVYLDSRNLFNKLGNEIDGYFMDNINPINSNTCESIRTRILSIKNNIEDIPDYNDRMIAKALQFAYTREVNLLPYRDRNSSIGYHIPFLSSVISDKDIIHVFHKIDKLVKKTYMTSTLMDKVNLCSTCQSSYLNFHETCSKCASIDLKYENLVHHFRCAYIGPESDFKKDDTLHCPKCDRQLKHIGIDYDKPAEIASCNCCTHTSQETKMKASCIDCGEKNNLSQLNTLLIKQYELTMKGVEWVLEQKYNANTIETKLQDLSIVPTPIFNLLVAQEKARSANSDNGSSFVGEIKIDKHLLDDLAEDFRNQLKDEVLKILKTYLREIDVLSAKHAGHYKFLLPDCSQAKAYDLYLLLLDNLNKLLNDNMGKSGPVVTGDLRKL